MISFCLIYLWVYLPLRTLSSHSNHTMHGLMPVSNGASRLPILPPNSRLLFIGDGWCESCRDKSLNYKDAFLGSSYVNILSAYYRRYFNDFNIQFYNRCNRGSDFYDFTNNLWKNDIVGVDPTFLTISFGMGYLASIIDGSRNNDINSLEPAIDSAMIKWKALVPGCSFIFLIPALVKTPVTERNWNKWITMTTQMSGIIESVARKANALVVPLQDVFDRAHSISNAGTLYWVKDTVLLEPTDAGSHLVAEEWLKVLSLSPALQSVEQSSLSAIRNIHSYSKAGELSHTGASDHVKGSQKRDSLHWGVACRALPADSTVLFNGDSITDAFHTCGNGDSMGQGYAFLVSSYFNRHCAARNVRFYNRGKSGTRLYDQLNSGDVARNLDIIKPNVVSWLIGINDVWFAKDGNFDPVDYERLLESTITLTLSSSSASSQPVKLVLMTPYVLRGLYTSDTGNWTSWQSNVMAARNVVISVGAKHNIPVVNTQAALDSFVGSGDTSHAVFDGVHPTEAGYQVIAEEWFRVVGAAWGS